MSHDEHISTLSQPVWIQNPELFNLEALSTSEGLEAASTALQIASSTSSNPTLVLNAATTYLLQSLPPAAFPLLLSFDVLLNQEISDALFATFPTTAKGFMNSNQQEVLNNLNSFYHSFPDGTEMSKLDSIHPRLHRIAPVLAILSQTTFDSTSSLSPIIISDGNFHDIGACMPGGLEEAKRLETDLLDELKGTLKIYISYLLRPVSYKHASNLLSAQLTPISDSLSNSDQELDASLEVGIVAPSS